MTIRKSPTKTNPIKLNIYRIRPTFYNPRNPEKENPRTFSLTLLKKREKNMYGYVYIFQSYRMKAMRNHKRVKSSDNFRS